MPALVGLRERKKSETRRAIGAAARDLAVAHGPGAVTVEDIAAAANVSPRTVFNYFPTKEAAMVGGDPQRRFELLQCLESRPPGEPPLTAMREAFRDFFTPETAVVWRARARLARDHPQLQSAYLAGFSTFEDELTEAMGRRTGLDAGKDPYPRLLVSVAGTALRVAVNHAIDAGRAAAMDDVIDDVFRALGSGLAPPERPHRPTRRHGSRAAGA